MEIRKVGIVGAGTMGHGIAQVVAASGYAAALHDADEAQLERARQRIGETLEKGIQRRKITPEQRDRTLQGLSYEVTIEDAVEGAELIIEAVPERLELKRKIFGLLDRLAVPEAHLATNTSSLSVSEIARATSRPERVLGLHFFNPVHVMKLLEVVRGAETSAATVALAVSFSHAIGKEPIVVTDTPGFASSRLGVVLGLEAMRMLDAGVASAEDIDRAMELGYNHPMGPLRLTDLVGLDVRLGIAEYLHEKLGGNQYEPPELLRRMVAEGRLGKKTGRGFYDWEER